MLRHFTSTTRFVFIFVSSILLITQTIVAAPTISVWHGLTQSFGQIGNPQTAINILGNVSDPAGMQSLSYTLNGGSSTTLSIGPDTRRLLSPGDFNIDIYTSSLNNGANTVSVTATNNLSQTSVANITVNYTAGQSWPATYSINWNSAGTIQNVAQVVDGHWTLFGGTIRPTFLGYDRLVAIGNKTWTDYEVTVPITIYNIDSGGFAYPSNGPGVGILMRWTGHTDNPISGSQPKTGYLPLGALGWYNWDQTGGGVRLKLYGNNLNLLAQDNSGFMLTFGVTYIFKMRVTTIPGVGGEYKMRVWQSGQSEPSTWTLSATETLSDPQAGSLCLVAHHVNASFGNVTVTGIATDTTAPVISNISASSMPTTSMISWTTNEASTSLVQYGLTTSYELGTISLSDEVTSHAVHLTGLTPSTLYHFKVKSTDVGGNQAQSSDETFTTSPTGTLTTDHFSAGSLNSSLWAFVNPLDDATLSVNGSQLTIAIPAGVPHDVWAGGNFGPRVIQSIPNSNFEVQLKFETSMNQQNQMSGLMVEENNSNFMRFDFLYDGSSLRVFSASFVGGNPTTQINTSIGGASVTPLYLRVNRTGNTWSASYSFDGINWTVAGSYSHTITVRSVGPFFATSGSNSPALTGRVNYFLNTAESARADIRAYLQGPFTSPGDSMRTSVRAVVPLAQPYNVSPWNYAGSESAGVLPTDVVDWILLELRTSTASATQVARRAAFIKRDGSIVDTDGASTVHFSGLAPGEYYGVVRHRNHLPVMSATPVPLSESPTQYSFVGSQSRAYGSSAMVELASGIFGLPAGDANKSANVSSFDVTSVLEGLNSTSYSLNDLNLSGIVTSADLNMIFGNLNKTSQVP